jgi:hypothetical protein
MIGKKRDIRKIREFLPGGKSVISRKRGFGPPVRLVQFLERGKTIQGIVNKHFHSYSLLSPMGARALFSSAAAEKQLSRIYESFYQKKLETERHYYRSKPTMAYKMLKSIFNYDYRKETELVYRKAPPAPAAAHPPAANYKAPESERGVRVLRGGKAAGLTKGDLATITENVLAALTRQRLREERRKGR